MYGLANRYSIKLITQKKKLSPGIEPYTKIIREVDQAHQTVCHIYKIKVICKPPRQP